MTSTEIHAHLMALAQERSLAEAIGMRPDGAYMADLEDEIATYRQALVGIVITEIAVLHGELFGRNHG
jgi:hypothetical protein